MSSPASLRPFAACSTLAVLAALVGCGNRGELYLEPSVDASAEAELRRLGSGAPTADPETGPASGVPAAPEPRSGDEEDDDEGDGRRRDAGDEGADGA